MLNLKKIKTHQKFKAHFFNLKMKLSIPLVSPLLWRIFHVIFDMIPPPLFMNAFVLNMKDCIFVYFYGNISWKSALVELTQGRILIGYCFCLSLHQWFEKQTKFS